MRRALILVAALVAAVASPATAVGDDLPPGYGYELVAPPFTFGQTVGGGSLMIAPDGNGLILSSLAPLEGAGNAPDLGAVFYAHRTDSGWRTVPLIPPASAFPTWNLASAGGIDMTADARTSLWWVQRREDKNTRRFTPVLSDADGKLEVAGPTIDGGTDTGPATSPIGTSADLRTIVFESRLRNFATDGAPDNRLASLMGLYVSRPSPDAPGEFRVRQVAFQNGAAMLRTCRVILGSERSARGAVSQDGFRIFFGFANPGTCVAPANQRVWVRDGDAEPVDLSQSKCTTDCGAIAPALFEAASFDGQRVYFTTEQKLLDEDLDTSSRADLYVHDMAYPANSRLRVITASGEDGAGAGVLGVVRASDDGAYVYFVANGRPLAGENSRGESPEAGDNNLYVYHRPRSPFPAPESIHFVGRLDPGDVARGTQFSLLNAQNRPVNITPDGRYLLFAARADLTGDKLPGDDHLDLYRYDVVNDELLRVWSSDSEHNGTDRSDGIFPASIGAKETHFNGARQKERRGVRAISDDGATVGFETAEPLSPDDTNDLRDAYMWRVDTGEITLLSGGRSILDLSLGGVGPNGDVFFLSDAPLVPQHRSGTLTTFVARQGGGFPAPPVEPDPCAGDGCQGPFSPPAPPLPSIGSVAFGDADAPSAPVRLKALVGVARAKAVVGSAARVKVRVPDAGRISVAGRSIARRSLSASKPGSYTLKIALKRKARKSLRKKKRLKINARVSYRAKDGQSVSKALSVTFKQPKPKRVKAKKGGR